MYITSFYQWFWMLLNRSIICVFILSRTCINNLYIEWANRLYHAFLRYCCCYRAVSYSLYRSIILSSSPFSASFELFVRRLVCVGQLRIDLNNIEHTHTHRRKKTIFLILSFMWVCLYSQYRDFLKWNYGIIYEIIVTHVCQIKWKVVSLNIYYTQHIKYIRIHFLFRNLVCDSAEIYICYL